MAEIDCSICEGKGFITIEDIRIDGYHGLPNKKCNTCGGSGKIQISEGGTQMMNEKDTEEARDTAREILLKYKSNPDFDVLEATKIIELRDSRIRSDASQAKEAEITAILLDPAAVYNNYLRGTINASAIIEAEVTHRLDEEVKAEREKWKELLLQAMVFVRVYAHENPRWTPVGMAEQDPNGVHAFIEKASAIVSDDQESEKFEVVVGSKWNYDRSLDHATWKPPLIVKEIVDGINEKAVIFDQPTPYKSYGISYFGIGFDFPFTPYKESNRG